MIELLSPLLAQAETDGDADVAAAENVREGFTGAWSTVIDSIAGLWNDFLERLPMIVVAVVVLLLAWAIARLARRVVAAATRRSRLNRSLQELFQQFATLGVWVVALIVAAIVVFPGMTPAKVLAALGLGSIAIGFAFKDIVENFFAGILILWRFPFDPGDFVECDGISGRVEETTIRMTKIRQVDGQLVVMPNAQLFTEPVYVLTSRKVRRVTVICGVAYDEDVDSARDVIRAAVESCDTVNQQEPIEIFAQEFASSSINFEVTWWTGSHPREIRASRDEVVAKVKAALDDAGIEIPFPYRTLTFKEPLETRLDGVELREAAESPAGDA